MVESSCFETLWQRFAERLERGCADPIQPETLVVPAAGWESYLTRRVVERLGCWGNYQFYTQGQWMERVLRRTLGDAAVPRRDVTAMTWQIASALDELSPTPGFESVRRYIQHDGRIDPMRKFPLAEQIARLFDQYIVYRPALIDAWNAGLDSDDGSACEHAAWQGTLWRAIRDPLHLQPLRSVVQQLIPALQADASSLPARVSVWLCSGVWPVFVDCLRAISPHCDLTLYNLMPTDAFDNPQPLVQSWGVLSQERRELLSEESQSPAATGCERVEADTLLHRVQTGIRTGDMPSLSADASMQFHSAHGPQREVEILRNQLRDAMEKLPHARCEDVVVLCCDLETYAPYIEAVFGATRGGTDHIPYQIAGRSPRRTRPIIDTFFRLLTVLQGRFGASEVMDLLSSGAMIETLDLSGDDVGLFRQWVQDSGIRWGTAASQRIDEGVGASPLNTWKFGLERLLMGYAMPPGGGQRVGHIVALDRGSGLRSEAIGRFGQIIEGLSAARSQVRGSRSVMEWQEVLTSLVQTYIQPHPDTIGTQCVLDAIDQLARCAKAAGVDEPIELPLLIEMLEGLIEQSLAGRPFRLGGVTFCNITAMRSLRFEVVAILGANDDVLPRTDRPVGFDLMNGRRQRGDRSLRLEDKHLFLEAILAAGERLIVTWQGQNTKDHRRQPASSMVEELLDALDLRDEIVVRHPLQPFSQNYFNGQDPRLVSYDKTSFAVAQKLAEPRQTTRPSPVVGAGDEAAQSREPISRRELRQMLESPWTRYLQAVDAGSPDEVDALCDREVQLLDPLEQWQLGDAVLQATYGGEDVAELVDRLRDAGELPAGALGDVVADEFRGQATSLVTAASKYAASVATERIEVAVGDVTVADELPGVFADGLCKINYSKQSTKTELRMWLDHLLLTLARPEQSVVSRLITRAPRNKSGVKLLCLPAVGQDEARAYLESLVGWQAVSSVAPLPWFGACVAPAFTAQKKGGDPLAVARAEFTTQAFGSSRPSPSETPSVVLAFDGRDPLAMTCGDVGMADTGNLFLRLVSDLYTPFAPYKDQRSAVAKALAKGGAS